MPALSGMLLIPNELLAILRKAFSQGQRINRAIGVLYLRPLVGSLSAIVAAVLLYASNLGLERGIGFGAHFIEVYAADCNDPILGSLLTPAGALLKL